MFFSVAVIIVSTALFLFYLQATCERILRREFQLQYFRSVARGYQLEFDSLGRWSPRQATVSTRLRVDFLKLTALMKNARFKGCLSNREGLLILYFRVLLWLFVAGQIVGVGEEKLFNKLTAILRYFANLIGQRESALPVSFTPSEYLLRV